MSRLIDLTGEVFGRLTVIRYQGKNEKGIHTWVCRCECGNVVVARGDVLRYGKTRSCGCLAHETYAASGRKSKGRPSPRLIDLTGQNFGFLTVIERGENSRTGQTRWRCRCICGRETLVLTSSLRRKQTISCGCMGLLHATQAKIKHGDAPFRRTKGLYTTWAAMKRRCNNPNSTQYKYYGGKGIKVCEEWQDYRQFKAWALSHGYAEGLTIDRIDSGKDYEPENCQWITMRENISRAKRIPQDVENRAVEMLKNGEPGVKIMHELHISRPTVSRLKKALGLARKRKTKVVT